MSRTRAEGLIHAASMCAGMLLGSIALSACDEGALPSMASHSFESDWPGVVDGRSRAGQVDAGAVAPATETDAQRVIEEADIIQVHGSRLYALSRYGGLNVLDISQPKALRLLGRYRDTRQAQPFEMYLRNDVALVMFSSWGQYVASDAAYAWVQTSKVLALDVSDPTQIRELGSFDVPGAVSDSRVVGDVLYVVGYQDGACWGCQQSRPRTSVVSLDIADVHAIAKADELFFDDDQNSWGWNRRSISVTSQRMYVAGIEYGNAGPVGSTIQVVDISDPAGGLVMAASVQVEGQVSSRWQMDEHAGVLRVIMQAPPWRTNQPPVVQTFAVTSSQVLSPLGRTELILPRPEALQSVRFDATRAYAITSERTDPLFTLDLSDPKHPKQMGALEMPGWLFYMEPRGDRVFGLGFDQSSSAGALTVSLFDVSDLSQPRMLDRVSFGGVWGSLPEDQDRIHKAFRVLDDLGLILVPYSGYSRAGSTDLCGSYGSGVQLVDFTRESLTLQGSVPARGEARRAFIHDHSLVSVSDERVETFDIADRKQPVRTGTLTLAQNVGRALDLDGGVSARLSVDWWASTPYVDFVAKDQVEVPNAQLSTLELGAALEQPAQCLAYVSVEGSFADQHELTLLYRRQRWDSAKGEADNGVLVIDASNPKQPSVRSHVEWPVEPSWWRYDGFYGYGLPVQQNAVVRSARALALLEASYVQQGEQAVTRNRLRVVDLSDTTRPKTTTLELPQVAGYTGLLVDGDVVLTSHYETTTDHDGRVRFYLDRIDLSEPSAPKLLSPISVPGALLFHAASAQRAVTVELRRTLVAGVTWQQCDDRFAHFEFTSEDASTDWTKRLGVCTGYRAVLHLLQIDGQASSVLDSYELPEHQAIRSTSLGDGMLFVTLGEGYWGYRYGLAIDCLGPCAYPASDQPVALRVLGGLRGAAFTVGALDAKSATHPWWGYWSAPAVHASGHKALLVAEGEAAIIDASQPDKPGIERTLPLPGWVNDVSVRAGSALLSLGAYGVQRVEIGE